ncbi:42314_t:CDS:1, partial [Gigaspora margarita]
TTFNLYIEGSIQATPFLQTHTNNPLENLALSPVLQENNEHLEFSISSCPQSILTLSPEDLDDPENFAGPSQSPFYFLTMKTLPKSNFLFTSYFLLPLLLLFILINHFLALNSYS